MLRPSSTLLELHVYDGIKGTGRSQRHHVAIVSARILDLSAKQNVYGCDTIPMREAVRTAHYLVTDTSATGWEQAIGVSQIQSYPSSASLIQSS